MGKTQNIYDNETFFEGYKKIRQDKQSANILEEIPAIYSLAPDLHGKDVIDLGCGYAEHCAHFKKMGAKEVVGVDISEKMLEVAKRENPGIKFVRADISDLSFVHKKYDVVFSSLTLHYIKDFNSLAKQVFAILKKGGEFIFSQEHPFSTAPIDGPKWIKNEKGETVAYNLSDYALSGKRKVNWLVEDVIMYHRTFSEVINALIDAGFKVERVLEPLPSKAAIKKEPKLKRRYHKPNFLIIKAVKK